MLNFDGIRDLRARAGSSLGVSEWHEITQDRINAFAAATDDYEQIHVDPERAKLTPWGVTIAPGLYVLSLGPKFLYELSSMTGVSIALNYGYDRVRFVSPVLLGSEVRMAADLLAVTDIEGGARFTIRQTFELAGSSTPACGGHFIA